MEHIIEEVEILWPKVDRTYRFDNKEKRSVPCSPTEAGAEYRTDFLMPSDTAKDLYKLMLTAYQEARDDDWPEKFDVPFDKQDDGRFRYNAKLKGAYDNEPTRKPLQVDADTNKLPDDFRLTTGSTGNVCVVFIPYHGGVGTGVSLRLKAIQVTELAPEREAQSPFGKVKGFTMKDDNPFVKAAPAKEEPVIDDIFGEEKVEQPKVAKSKKKKAAPKEKGDLSSIVEGWDD
tara:strand:+ start:413 stop:1105 length:693 start_codon:yes stop_codon:yes gene_type:complete